MFGYVYKTTNNINGNFYIGKREYRKDEESNCIYFGSSKHILNEIDKYGKENFTKEILEECETNQELFIAEEKYILDNINNKKCLNNSWGKGFGGIYKEGYCSCCGEYKVLYHDDKCMSCIKQDNIQYEWCEECKEITPRYKDGTCRKCVSKLSHHKKFCNFCEDETTHMGNNCKSHHLVLKKNLDTGKIELWNNRHIIFEDISFIEDIQKYTVGKSTDFVLPENSNVITKSNNKNTKITHFIKNKDVPDWVKITYKYDNRNDHTRTLMVTSDHPLPVESGEIKSAIDLTFDDKLLRVLPKKVGAQSSVATIINLEYINTTKNSFDITTETGYFDINNDILSHNCRSFLTPYIDENGNPKYYGRMNQGVVTINLPDVALSSEGNFDDFWEILDERLELCHKALKVRHERLEGTLSDVAPILWQHGALARLEKGETIDKLLHGGYSTISLGYAGLYECVKYMTGHSHTDEGIGEEFGLKIMQRLNDKCNEWKEAEDIAYSPYGTPIESTVEKFAKSLKRRFGIIEGITDKGYITNSYHTVVTEEINPFKKLEIESKFAKLSGGGNITYIESADMTQNVEAVLEVIKFIYNNVMYSEINTKSDYCQVCGYDGEIKIYEDESGRLGWVCPNCGNTDQHKMNVARRVCGYISTNFFNQGRTDEIRNRYIHLDNHEAGDC